MKVLNHGEGFEDIFVIEHCDNVLPDFSSCLFEDMRDFLLIKKIFRIFLLRFARLQLFS